MLCAHVRAVRSLVSVPFSVGSCETVMLKAQRAALSTTIPRERDRLSSHYTPSLGHLRRGIPRLSSPPLRQKHKQILRATPAILQIAPLECTRDTRHALFVLKQNQPLPERGSVTGRWPADPRDQEHPGVSWHERGSCSTVGPGRMRQATTLVSCHRRGLCLT